MDKLTAVVHTVLVMRNQRGGLALGLDDDGKPFKIWLQTPRAVELAIDQVERLGNLLKTTATEKQLREQDTTRITRLVRRKAREWDLA